MKYECADLRRRAVIRGYTALKQNKLSLNGIDFLEVEDGKLNLRLRFLKKLDDPAELSADKFSINGGERIQNLRVKMVTLLAPNELLLTVDQIGDYSLYQLRIEGDWITNWFDTRLMALQFSIQVDCLTDACAPEPSAPPEPLRLDGIDYLAKDYASFRRLMLDRLASLVPDWKARSPADLGMAMVEVLAYVGDYLSYQQDAIAAEAYLDTARRRVSVRRHARLVDYSMHDGCNARVWVQVAVNGPLHLPSATKLATGLEGKPLVIDPGTAESLQKAGQIEIFETLHPAQLDKKHNQINFYTWGDRDCALTAGATRATLLGHFPAIQEGQVLILAEFLPDLENKNPAIPGQFRLGRCHPVRLSKVDPNASDPLGTSVFEILGAEEDPGGMDNGLALTEISWSDADALPFDLRISAPGSDQPLAGVLGNIVLADHGWWESNPELLPPAPAPRPILPRRKTDGELANPAARYRPHLAGRDLTFSSKNQLPDNKQEPGRSAASFLVQTLKNTLPEVRLVEIIRNTQGSSPNGQNADPEDEGISEWQPQRDLLKSGANDKHFVVEIESDGTPFLRFGDNFYGKMPPVGTSFSASLRVGNGQRGNIGADKLTHLVTTDTQLIQQVSGVSNPMPAQGGQDPESVSEARRKAPYAYQRSERAVRPEDYVEMACRHPEVQRAAAKMRWTGSWNTVYLAVDRRGGLAVDRQFKEDLGQHLEAYRLAGHDLEITAPVQVALAFEITACLKSNASRPAVLAELRRRLLPGRRSSAKPGFFHPDHFTFGQPVYLSALVAALNGTPGLASLSIQRFERREHPDPKSLEDGVITTSWSEIACMDGDLNYPEHGTLRIALEGGL